MRTISRRMAWRCGLVFAALLGGAARAEVVVHTAPPPAGGDASGVLQQALTAARAARSAHPGEAVAIELAPGTYHVTHALSLSAADSGATGAPLTLRASAAGGVRILGSMPLTQRAPPSAAVRARAPGASLVIAFQADPATLQRLSTAKPKSSQRGNTGVALLLSQGEVRLQFARWPRQGYATAQPAANNGPDVAFSDPRAAHWAGETALWAGGFFNEAWNYETTRVTSVSPGGAVQLAPLLTTYKVLPSFHYFVFNALSELDTRGTYVADPQSGQIDVIPLVDPARQPVESAVAPSVIHVAGAHDVVFKGLEIANALGAAVVIDGSDRIVLDGCLVTRTGGPGVRITGGSGDSVQRSVVSDTGEEGVILSAGDRTTLIPANHQVLDSIIVHTGQEIRAYRPAVRLDGVGNAVAGSILADAPHSAIMFQGNDHKIQRNEIFQVNTETDDAGAIYVDRDPGSRGTQIIENYFHDIQDNYKGPNGRGVWVVYLDDYSSGITINRNLFLHTPTGVFIHGGSDNVVTQNLFVAVASPAVLFVDMTGSWASVSAQVEASLDKVQAKGAVYARRYPALAKEISQGFATARGNRIGPNLVTGADPVGFFKGTNGALQTIAPPVSRRLNGTPHQPAEAALAVGGDPYGLPLDAMDRRRVLGDLPFAGVAQGSLH